MKKFYINSIIALICIFIVLRYFVFFFILGLLAFAAYLLLDDDNKNKIRDAISKFNIKN